MRVLDGRFVVVDQIARGAHAVVWLGWDTMADEWVAIKELEAPGEVARQRFVREQEMDLAHPRLLTRTYSSAEAGAPFAVFPLVRGGTLAQLIGDSGPLNVGAVGAIVAQLLEATSGAHSAGVVHRDIQSSNVLLKPSGPDSTEPDALLSDFGQAARRGGVRLSMADWDLPGTPGFRAPEVGDQEPTSASDLYGIGATAYHALTGRVPVHTSEPSRVDDAEPFDDPETLPFPADLPPRIRALLVGLLQPDPDQRMDVVDAARAAASVPVAPLFVPARIELPAPPHLPRSWRSWRVLSVAAAVVLLTALIGGAAFAGWARGSWFVGADGERVAVFRGRPGVGLGFDPIVERHSDVTLTQLTRAEREQVVGRPTFGSADEAWAYVASFHDLIQRRTITTIAGDGVVDEITDGEPANQAGFGSPEGLAILPDGTVLVTDTWIYAVTEDGTITTVAGNGVDWVEGGSATSLAVFTDDVVAGADGTPYYVDDDATVRRIDETGAARTVVGNGRQDDLAHDRTVATEGAFQISDVVVDDTGAIYFNDRDMVRRVGSENQVTTIAGSQGWDVRVATDAETAASNFDFRLIDDLALDAAGNLLVADAQWIHRIDREGEIETIYGGTLSSEVDPLDSSQYAGPWLEVRDLAVAADGAIYFLNHGSNRLRRLATDGTVTVVAGSATDGFSGDGGPAEDALLSDPSAVEVDADGLIYITDTGNRRVRRIGPP